MENSKLITYLKTFSESDMKELGKYLGGPSQRKSSGGVVGLFKYLKKYHPVFPEKKIKRAEVQKKLFSEVNNADKRLTDVMYHLVSTIENFLVKKKLEERPTQWNFLLLEAQKERKLDKLFFQKIGTIEKEWQKKDVPGLEHLLDQYLLKRMCFLHPNSSVFNDHGLKIDQLALGLDQYYFASKLYWEMCDSLTKNKANSITTKQYLIEEVKELSENGEFIGNLHVQLFSDMLKIFKSKDVNDYDKIKELFFENKEVFNEYEKFDLLNGLFHICYLSYDEGDNESVKELFELNKFAVENDLFIEDGYYNVLVFQHVVIVCCAAGELDWATYFVNNFSEKIKESDRDDMISLCKANICLHKKDFEQALQKIAAIKLKNPLYGLQARFIQLQCYFELKEYRDLFDNLVRSFSVYLHRDEQLSAPIKEKANNFIQYINKLKKLEDPNQVMDLDLARKIREDRMVACKVWLVQKLDELQGIEK